MRKSLIVLILIACGKALGSAQASPAPACAHFNQASQAMYSTNPLFVDNPLPKDIPAPRTVALPQSTPMVYATLYFAAPTCPTFNYSITALDDALNMVTLAKQTLKGNGWMTPDHLA